MAINVIGCIFCLIQLRAAALLVIFTVLVPFTVHFVFTGIAVFIAIACNVVLVLSAMLFVVLTQYRTFAELIEVQSALVARNQSMKALSDANHEFANIDALTSLPNRRYFFGELDSLLTAQLSEGFSLGIVDLDGFKPVNDLYGHTAGDKVLAEAARRIRDVSPEYVFVARLGGDEFALLCENDSSGERLKAAAEKICEALRQPFFSLRTSVHIAGSIGVSVHQGPGNTAEHIYERADYALYYAKQNLRGNVVMFSEVHETELRDLHKMEQALWAADLKAEMHVVYQPLVDTARGQIKGFEALARWSSEILGDIQPSLFIRAAERTGIIAKLTPILLEKALRDLRHMPSDMMLSFNLSVHDLCSPQTMVSIIALVRAAGVDPARLEFEVTETAIMVDFDQACDALKLLRNLGAKIAPDDFGTGYSSLIHVHRLPLDTIKIDRAFVEDIETNPTSGNLVRSIVDMSRNLGVGCIVEGVETERQVELLRGYGLVYMQGFYFGRPGTADDILKLCREGLPSYLPASGAGVHAAASRSAA